MDLILSDLMHFLPNEEVMRAEAVFVEASANRRALIARS